MKQAVWVPMLFAVLFIGFSIRCFSWIISSGYTAFGAAGSVALLVAMGFAITACVNAKEGGK